MRAAGTEPTDVLKQAIQLVENGALSKQDAILQITPDLLNRLLASFFSAREVQQAVRAKRLLLKGVGCGTDVATGFVALDAAAAFRLHCRGKPVILVGERLSYLERDVLPLIQGFVVKEGPIAAALHWEKPGLVSAGYEALTEGMEVSLDPLAGFVIEGSLELHPGRVTSELLALLEWADEFKSLEIRTNASFPEEIATALAMGASGVGLCRIESIILQPNRLGLFSQVLKECVHGATNSDLLRALEQEIAQELLLLFQAVGPGKPFTIRLLDAPIAQLLRFWRDSEYVAKDYFDHLLQGWLQELNPMGGLRFGRLSLLFPDLLSFQLRAILKAFKAQPVRLQIMMPGVTDASEVMLLRREVEALAGALEVAVPMVGSMLETPRACLTIDRLVRVGDFFFFWHRRPNGAGLRHIPL